MQCRDEGDHTEVAGGHLGTKIFQMLNSFSMTLFYLNTCDCIHCYNKEGIEIGEDIFVDDENAGVESQEK